MKIVREKIEGTTSIGSFIGLILILVVFHILATTVATTGLLNAWLSCGSLFALAFLFFKFYLTFLSSTDYNEKGLDIEARTNELYEIYGFDPYNRLMRLHQAEADGRVTLCPTERSSLLHAEIMTTQHRIDTIIKLECEKRIQKQLRARIREVVIGLMIAALAFGIIIYGGVGQI